MKIVLAYSGGLDTSVLLSWIKERYDAEMIAFCANIGQEEELKGLTQKAKRTGASKVYIVDLQEEFARDFIFPMIQASAVYESQYFLGTSIARPLIAKGMIDVARKEKADALAHGATGKGNDQVRFELTAAALAPELEVIAPWRDARFRDEFPGVYETPGGAILHFAHRQMETLTMDREVMHLRDSLVPRYAELVYYGYWFAPERLALQALVTESQKNITGTVRVKLYKGNIMCSGRKSPVSLYNPAIATMEADPTKAYNQDDATGFIRLNGLRLKVAAKVHRKR